MWKLNLLFLHFFPVFPLCISFPYVFPVCIIFLYYLPAGPALHSVLLRDWPRPDRRDAQEVHFAADQVGFLGV